MTERKIALSIEEAADYTGIGRNTLRKLVEWKKLPVLKVGRKVLSLLSLSVYWMPNAFANPLPKLWLVPDCNAFPSCISASIV